MAEGRQKAGLTRDHAPEALVGEGAVAEDSRNAGKGPISGRPATRGCLTDPCDGGERGRRPIIDRSDTRPWL